MIFGRHKKIAEHSKKVDQVNVNVIPMIDMMIVMNVYLLMQTMVASFAKYQGAELVLPRSLSDDELPYETEVAVTEAAVYMEGQLAEPNFEEYADKDVPELAGLSDLLQIRKDDMIAKGNIPEGASEAGSGFPVVIRAHEGIEFKMLQKVMYTCNIRGFDRIELAVVKDEKLTTGSAAAAP